MTADRDRLVRIVAATAVVVLFALVWRDQRAARNETEQIISLVEKVAQRQQGADTVQPGDTTKTPSPGALSPTEPSAAPSALPPSRLTPLEREDLVKRNPFKIDEEKNVPPAPTRALPTPPTPPPTRRPTQLKLVGTIVGDGSGWAIIQDLTTRVEDYYRPGSQVGTAATLLSVERSAAVLLINGQKERLEINWKTGQQAAASVPPRSPPPRGRPGLFRRHSSPPPAPASTGDSRVAVKKSDLDKNFRNLSHLLTQMRVQPFFEKGKPAGFLISSVRRGSFVERLGAKSGDIIRSVNGERIDSVQKAFKLYNAFKDNSALQVSVTRGGKLQNLNFTIE